MGASQNGIEEEAEAGPSLEPGLLGTGPQLNQTFYHRSRSISSSWWKACIICTAMVSSTWT